MSKLWSIAIAQDPAASAADREVLARRFSSAIVIILPLSDGTFAILSADRQLHIQVSEPPSAADLVHYSELFEHQARQRATAIPRALTEYAPTTARAPREPVVVDW